MVSEMSTNNSKFHLGTILVNSAVPCNIVEKYEKMLSQSRKVTDQVEKGTSSFS